MPLRRQAALRAAIGAPILAAGTSARAAGQPASLRGTVEGAPTDPDLAACKLGVAVVGLGHLALNEVLPGTLTGQRVRVVALVSGSVATARAVACSKNGADVAAARE